jgi:hypothetical protein
MVRHHNVMYVSFVTAESGSISVDFRCRSGSGESFQRGSKHIRIRISLPSRKTTPYRVRVVDQFPLLMCEAMDNTVYL